MLSTKCLPYVSEIGRRFLWLRHSEEPSQIGDKAEERRYFDSADMSTVMELNKGDVKS